MKNLIQAATVLSKTSFVVGDMETDAINNFFKIDQIETKGLNFILVCCQNLETVSIITDGDISVGSNIMDSDAVGNRTLLYSGAWTFTADTGDGSIWVYALKPNADVDLTNFETPYNVLPYDEYALAGDNKVKNFRTVIVAPFIPPLIDIIFRAPVAQTEIDMNITVYGLNV